MPALSPNVSVEPIPFYDRSFLLQARTVDNYSDPYPIFSCTRRALLRQLKVHRSVQEIQEVKDSLQKPFYNGIPKEDVHHPTHRNTHRGIRGADANKERLRVWNERTHYRRQLYREYQVAHPTCKEVPRKAGPGAPHSTPPAQEHVPVSHTPSHTTIIAQNINKLPHYSSQSLQNRHNTTKNYLALTQKCGIQTNYKTNTSKAQSKNQRMDSWLKNKENKAYRQSSRQQISAGYICRQHWRNNSENHNVITNHHDWPQYDNSISYKPDNGQGLMNFMEDNPPKEEIHDDYNKKYHTIASHLNLYPR